VNADDIGTVGQPRLPLYLDAFTALQVHVDSVIKLADLYERVALGGPFPNHEELAEFWPTAALLRRIAEEVRR
jgi:hypothetical protein